MRFFASLALGALLPLSLAASGGEWKTVLEDGFKILPPKRVDGAKLAGIPAESGGLWKQKGNAAILQLSSEGGVVSGHADGGKAIALLDCVPSGAYQIKLEADLQPGGSDWLAVGFGAGDEFFWSKGQGQLWVTVKGSRAPAIEGLVEVYANGTSSCLKKSKAAERGGFDPAKPLHVEIVYSQPENKASVFIDGKAVVENASLGEFKPQIGSAGIMCNLPKADDPAMKASNFKVSLKDGELQAPAKKLAEGKPVLLIDSTAVKRTNLNWGVPSDKGGEISVDLQAESSLEPSAPYFAEFDFELAGEDSGDYVCWALVLACDEKWISEWAWSFDGAKPRKGVALEGSLAGMPRWIKFANVKLESGTHSLRFEVQGRRSFPDDAYVFHLWRLALAPAEVQFQPWEANAELGYNPQANMQRSNAAGKQSGAAAGASRQGRIASLRDSFADPVCLRVDFNKTAPETNPVWRDYSGGGTVSGDDFFIPYLVKPLRPRFIRHCHYLTRSVKGFGEDGRPVYDFSDSHSTLRAIRAVGAEPIVGLDNPPTAIYPKAGGKPLPPKDWPDDPKFKKDWQELVTAFLKSCQGDKSLAVKYLQCFNEPEFSYKDSRASITIHQIAAQAVKDFDKSLVMAGIGCGNSKSPVYYDFLNSLKGSPARADVFDYHQYQTTPQAHASLVKELRGELDGRDLKDVKIAATEWGIASSGRAYHRAGVRNATYNASCLKALAEAGLDIGGLFCIRDFESETWKWGLITVDGFLKPAYWGQWLWAQLPENGKRLAVEGGDARVQSFAFKDGDGLAILVWYDAQEGSPLRDVSVFLESERWSGYTLRQWQLDSTRHIGFVPEGSPVELPCSVKSQAFKKPEQPFVKFKMPAPSMRLLKLSPLKEGEEAPAARRSLLDDPGAYGKAKP